MESREKIPYNPEILMACCESIVQEKSYCSQVIKSFPKRINVSSPYVLHGGEGKTYKFAQFRFNTLIPKTVYNLQFLFSNPEFRSGYCSEAVVAKLCSKKKAQKMQCYREASQVLIVFEGKDGLQMASRAKKISIHSINNSH